MPLSVIGINHRSAPVEIREQVAFAAADLPRALASLRQCTGVQEAAILSTCNRTEVYCCIEATGGQGPIEWLLSHHGLKTPDLRRFLYAHAEEETVRHLLQVACGLDSMVLGEPQILGQLKTAYQTATEQGTIGRLLNKLFQHAFFVAKKVRTDTAIGSSPVSVAFAAVRLAQQIHGDLRGKTALLIGAGDTIELAAHHLHENRLSRMLIANRSLERAQALASRFGGYALPLTDIPLHLAEADIVIASTAAPTTIVSRRAVEQAMAARRRQPMFLVDIAVPRDIEPGVADVEDAYLYSIDDLQAVIEENLRSRQAAALQAQEIIDTQTRHFLEWLRQRDALNVVLALRTRAEGVRDELLARALRQIEQGADAREALQFLATTLTSKLIHAPTVKLKEAGTEGHDEMIQTAIELFDIKNGP